jgi:hypothetical protein
MYGELREQTAETELANRRLQPLGHVSAMLDHV